MVSLSRCSDVDFLAFIELALFFFVLLDFFMTYLLVSIVCILTVEIKKPRKMRG